MSIVQELKEKNLRCKDLLVRIRREEDARIRERIESLERCLEYERKLNAKLEAQIAEMQDVAR